LDGVAAAAIHSQQRNMYMTLRLNIETDKRSGRSGAGSGPFPVWGWRNAGRPRLGYFSTNEDKHGIGPMCQDRELQEQFKTGSVGRSADEKTFFEGRVA
jgi:hypothetical protein